MKQKFYLFLVVFGFHFNTKAQFDSADLKIITTELIKNYNIIKNEIEFGPRLIGDINLKVFELERTKATGIVRKYVLNKKFKNEIEVLEALVPTATKLFVFENFIKPNQILTKNDSLIPKLYKQNCECADIFKKSGKEALIECIISKNKESTYSNEMKEQLSKLDANSLPDFLGDALMYLNYDCETMFKMYADIAKEEVIYVYKQEYLGFIYHHLFYVSDYINQNKMDSLKMIFPNYFESFSSLKKMANIFVDNKKINLNSKELFSNINGGRFSTFAYHFVEEKKKLLCQIVWEIAIDKPLPYLKKLNFIPVNDIGSLKYVEEHLK
jgi:hypothetical protein